MQLALHAILFTQAPDEKIAKKKLQQLARELLQGSFCKARQLRSRPT